MKNTMSDLGTKAPSKATSCEATAQLAVDTSGDELSKMWKRDLQDVAVFWDFVSTARRHVEDSAREHEGGRDS